MVIDRGVSPGQWSFGQVCARGGARQGLMVAQRLRQGFGLVGGSTRRAKARFCEAKAAMNRYLLIAVFLLLLLFIEEVYVWRSNQYQDTFIYWLF